MSDYSLAAGLNVALGGLLPIASITVGGDDQPFATPKGIPEYLDGDVEYDLDSHISVAGFASVTWLFGFMYFSQYAYLKTTYCAGGLSGDVTILTTLGSSTFTRKNAVMTLKRPKDQRSKIWYTDVEVVFTRLENPT